MVVAIAVLFVLYHFPCFVCVVVFSFHLAKFSNDSWCLLWPGADGKLRKRGYLCSVINQLTAQLKSIPIRRTKVREILTVYRMNCFEKKKTQNPFAFLALTNIECHFRQVNGHMRCNIWLTHSGRVKIAAIFQMTFSNGFSLMKMRKFRLRFHWSLSPMIQSTIFHYWF